MKKPTLQALVAFVLTRLNLKSLPTDEGGNLALSPENEKELQDYFPGDNFATMKDKLNEYLSESAEVDTEKANKQAEANKLLASVLENPEPEFEANVAKAATKIEEQKKVIQLLENEPEAAAFMTGTIRTALAGVALVASLSTPTHLFGRNAEAQKPMFSFEGRNWNAKAAGKSAAKTDFTDVSVITRLNEDLREYQIQNPNFIRELNNDRVGLPSFWPKRFGVIDGVQDVVMDIANVTQARKPDWTPGFEMYLDAEKRRIYRIQIDLEFDGYQLQELETSWLASIYNMDGSSPYKYSFVAFLINKINDKARQEDREGAINGIFAPNPKGIKMKGHYLNAQSGLRHQLYMFRDIFKKITPYVSKIGKFTSSNAYEYVKGFIESMPLAARGKQGLKLYIAPSNIVKIRDSYKMSNALNNDYSGNNINYIDGYPNIQFEGLQDLEGSNLMFITDDQNIEILEYLAEEKSKFRFEYLKRKTYIHADYRFGCAFVFSGFNLPSSEFKGQAQFVWVNDEPIFPDTVTVPLFGTHLSTPVTLNYNRLHVHPELISDIRMLQGLPAGTIVEITGNRMLVTNSKIKKSTGAEGENLNLTADFDPKTMYKLLMVVQADGSYKEIARETNFPSSEASSVKFDDSVVDVSEGAIQEYTGPAGELTKIVGGNEGSSVTISGGTNELTVKSINGVIKVNSDAVLTTGKSITLRNFGGVWYEITRQG